MNPRKTPDYFGTTFPCSHRLPSTELWGLDHWQRSQTGHHRQHRSANASWLQRSWWCCGEGWGSRPGVGAAQKLGRKLPSPCAGSQPGEIYIIQCCLCGHKCSRPWLSSRSLLVCTHEDVCFHAALSRATLYQVYAQALCTCAKRSCKEAQQQFSGRKRARRRKQLYIWFMQASSLWLTNSGFSLFSL